MIVYTGVVIKWLFASAIYSQPLGRSHYQLYHQVNDNGLVSTGGKRLFSKKVIFVV